MTISNVLQLMVRQYLCTDQLSMSHNDYSFHAKNFWEALSHCFEYL